MDQWEDDASFQALREIVTAFHVINDAAERGVKLGSDFTQVLTKSETGRQNVMQTVELARRAFPLATKDCFLKNSVTDSIPELMAKIDYDARHMQ